MVRIAWSGWAVRGTCGQNHKSCSTSGCGWPLECVWSVGFSTQHGGWQSGETCKRTTGQWVLDPSQTTLPSVAVVSANLPWSSRCHHVNQSESCGSRGSASTRWDGSKRGRGKNSTSHDCSNFSAGRLYSWRTITAGSDESFWPSVCSDGGFLVRRSNERFFSWLWHVVDIHSSTVPWLPTSDGWAGISLSKRVEGSGHFAWLEVGSTHVQTSQFMVWLGTPCDTSSIWTRHSLDGHATKVNHAGSAHIVHGDSMAWLETWGGRKMVDATSTCQKGSYTRRSRSTLLASCQAGREVANVEYVCGAHSLLNPEYRADSGSTDSARHLESGKWSFFRFLLEHSPSIATSRTILKPVVCKSWTQIALVLTLASWNITEPLEGRPTKTRWLRVAESLAYSHDRRHLCMDRLDYNNKYIGVITFRFWAASRGRIGLPRRSKRLGDSGANLGTWKNQRI